MKLRIAIIVSNIHRAISHEWTVEMLNHDRFEVFMVLMNPGDSAMARFLRSNNIPHLTINYQGKYELPRATIQIVRFLRKHKIKVIHAHLFEAGLASLMAGKIAGVETRIYTRHHATFHHDYFPRMIKYDRWINRMATRIVAPSEVVRKVLIEKEEVANEKIKLVHHGFRFEEFDRGNNRAVDRLIEKYQINGWPVIGVVSRWTKWKGVQYIIPAFRQLLNEFPNVMLLLANGGGDYANEIRRLVDELPESNFRILSFEEDFFSMYRLFNVLVHVPINDHSEAFGQVYVEALASGVPTVVTLSGIAREFMIHEENTLVVPYENSSSITVAIRRLLKDELLRKKIVERGKEAVHENFQLQSMIDAFEALYSEGKHL